jgi:hypothetical protein
MPNNNDEPTDDSLLEDLCERVDEVDRLSELLREARVALSTPITANLADLVARIDDEVARE